MILNQPTGRLTNNGNSWKREEPWLETMKKAWEEKRIGGEWKKRKAFLEQTPMLRASWHKVCSAGSPPKCQLPPHSLSLLAFDGRRCDAPCQTWRLPGFDLEQRSEKERGLAPSEEQMRWERGVWNSGKVKPCVSTFLKYLPTAVQNKQNGIKVYEV